MYRPHPPPLAGWNLMHRLPELTGAYWPWRTLRHAAKEKGFVPELAWTATKLQRLGQKRDLELVQTNGEPFAVVLGPHLFERLHRIDRTTGGGGPAAFGPGTGVLADDESRTRLRIRTLMVEAAESSLIEGAATTRREAVELLRSARPPTTQAERMVFNNFAAMRRLREWLTRPLSIKMLLELQELLVDGTLPAHECGRLRSVGEDVRVVGRDDEVIYRPPAAELLTERLERLCAFANAKPWITHVADSV